MKRKIVWVSFTVLFYVGIISISANAGVIQKTLIPFDWDISVVTSMGSAVSNNCIQVDQNGLGHFIFVDASWHLKYAYETGESIQIETVDDTGDIGGNFSFVLDDQGYPHISYFFWEASDLRYAFKNASGWTIITVDDKDGSGDYSSIDLDSNGNPHISYDSFYDGLMYAHYDGTTWSITNVDNEESLYLGAHNSLALDSMDYPHIAYYGGHNLFALKYAYKDATGWNTQTIDTDGKVTSMTIAVDSSNLSHICYHDWEHNQFQYAYQSGDKAVWNVETVEGNGWIGTALDLSADDSPHFSCFHIFENNVGYAHREMPGSEWIFETIEYVGEDYGVPSIAMDDSNLTHISYVNGIPPNLKHARQVIPASPTPVPCIHNGDVDDNGTITTQDALMAFQIYLEILPDATEQQRCSADCNGNEQISPIDALCIYLNYMSGACQCIDPLNPEK